MLLSRLAGLLGKPKDKVLHRYILLVVGASLVQGITFTMVVPVIDALLASRLQRAAYWLIPLATGTAFSGYLNYRASQSGFEVATTLLETVRHRIGDHVVTLPLGWFVRRNTSRLGMLLSQGVMDILGLPAHQLTPLIRAILTPGVVVMATCFFDWRVGLSAAALFPLVALVYWWAGKLGRAADRAVHASSSEASDRMVEFAQNQLILRTFGRGEQGFRHFDQALITQHCASRRQLWLVLPPLLANAWLGQLGVLLLMAGVTWLVLTGNDAQQQTTLLALLVLMNRVIEPLSEVATYSSGIRMATTQLDQVEQVLAQQPLPQPQRYTRQPIDHEVRFHDVTFSYHPGVAVLKNISVTLPGNTTTALVGLSGSGKSTFLQLIARFFDPDSGHITLGGADLKTLSAQQHMKMISQVFQGNYLFSGSLRENVVVGNPSASEDALRHVITVTRLDDVVSRLPQGWDSQVGEGGCLLSGGERQRVSIARALLKSAPILLLDEATGTLDAENQLAITRGLEALHGRCTLLVIAHQLSTIQNADCILVMDEGRIIEQGTHAELLTCGGRYADFWQAKIHAQGWRMQHTPSQSRMSPHD